jgi:hypothetical protein
MNKKVARISSKLYFDLYQKGGDKLIAVYSILKTSRNGEVKYYSYTSKNNKFVGGFSLLRSKTNLTLHSIKKYVPILIDMELCFIDKNGDFVMVGNEKIKDLYNSRKLVPITIGVNLTETTLYSFSVRSFSAEKKQQAEINKKLTRREILLQGANPKNLKELKRAKKVLRKYGEVIEINEKTVLSLQGFGVLKHSEENEIKDIKSSGSYWKGKLKKSNIIKTRREFKKIRKISFSEYQSLKKYGELSNIHTYKNGYLVEELISSFSTKSIAFIPQPEIEKVVKVKIESKEVEVYKKKPYLQVDMIDFWINGGD